MLETFSCLFHMVSLFFHLTLLIERSLILASQLSVGVQALVAPLSARWRSSTGEQRFDRDLDTYGTIDDAHIPLKHYWRLIKYS